MRYSDTEIFHEKIYSAAWYSKHSTIYGDDTQLDRSVIILAGGFSSRFGQDKGLLPLANRPLVRHVLERIDHISGEILIVVSSDTQAAKYSKVTDSGATIVLDEQQMQTPLAGAFTGFKEAHGKYSVLLPCDTPLVNKDVLLLLFDLCINKNAAVPRWPNGYTEPLQAVYCTKVALEAARTALCEGRMNVQSMLDRLRAVRYVSTLVLEQIDPDFRTFFNINTPLELKKAEMMLKHPVRAN